MNTFTRPKLSFGSFPNTPPPSVSSSRPKYPTYGPPSVSTSPPRLTLGGFLNKAVGYKTHDQYALDRVNDALAYPQSQTVNVDAGASVLDRLKGTAAAILDNMGSTGDSEAQPRRVAYSPAGEHGGQTARLLDSPVVLIGLVLGAGALIYAVNKG